MRVLYVIHYPFFGGPQNQALRLAGPPEKGGAHATVVLPEEPGNAADWLRAAGIDVRQMPLHRLRAMTDVRFHSGLVMGDIPWLSQPFRHGEASRHYRWLERMLPPLFGAGVYAVARRDVSP